LDMAGLVSLAAFVFWVSAIYVDRDSELQWVSQPLAALAILANIHRFRFNQIPSSMLFLVILCGYFSITAVTADQDYLWGSFTVWSKFTLLAFALSLVLTGRAQIFVVLGALAASSIYVAYASYGSLLDTQDALSQANQTGRGMLLARTAGVFGNANGMAMFAVDAIVAAVILFFSMRNWFTLALAVLSCASASYLALFSGSRKAILGFGIVVLFVLWQGLRARKRAVATCLAAVAVGIGGVVWILNNPYMSRFSADDDSYQVRTALLQEALQHVQQNPILGLGYHGFEQVSASGLYTHSTPFELLCDGGIVALGLYIMLWGGLGRSFYKSIRSETDEAEVTLLYGLACCLGIQALNSVTAVVFEEPRFLILIACIAGYLRSKELQSRRLGIRSLGRPFLAGSPRREPSPTAF
jgi:O-antigen ligase